MVKYIVGLMDRDHNTIVRFGVFSYSRAGALNKAVVYLQPTEKQYLKILTA